MTKEQERIIELEQALRDVLVNLEDDVPDSGWSKHLMSSVLAAYDLLADPQE